MFLGTFIPEGDGLREALALDPTETRGIGRRRLRSRLGGLSGGGEGRKGKKKKKKGGGRERIMH